VTRGTAIPALLLAAACAGTIACLDSSGPVSRRPVSPLDTLPGLLVSEPVDAPPVLGNAMMLSAGTSAAAHVVYVSMVPGTVPTGLQATIRDQASGVSVTTAVVNGGFDPVPIPAEVGDTLQVEITRTGAGPLKGSDLVKPIRPPTIVRTSPPKGGHDVPLNAVIVVVFSEPIDSATLTAESVQLWRDSVQVPGTVQFADAAHLRVEFRPDSLLASQTAYRFLTTQAIRDANGTPLDASLDVPFTTGVASPSTGLLFGSLTVGSYHTCGVTAAGKAYCWGSNAQGQLGDGTDRDASATPVPVAGGLTFASVSAGYASTCGVTTDGTAYCWGNGGMGSDSVTAANSCSPGLVKCPTPLLVTGGHTFRMVSVGASLDCGVSTDGVAYCWGSDDYGQLGIDSATLVATCRDTSPGNGYWWCPTPLPVAGGLSFAAVSTGEGHACGLTTGGTTYCWGGNAAGELGSGTTAGPEQCNVQGSASSCSHVPVAVAGGLTFSGISAGQDFTCGLAPSGAAYCWGRNGGALGTGSATGPETCVFDAFNSAPCSASPVPVTGGLVFRVLNAGFFGIGCGVTTDDAAYCWGATHQYVTGNWASPLPVPASGGLTFTSASAGYPHMCGLTSAGVAYCWGANGEGELGDGTYTDSFLVPVKVSGQ
jgi:alpha-tubulin suppressor-like RCC1 family protein